jgi:hypothetical protein
MCVPGTAQHAVMRCRPGTVSHSELQDRRGDGPGSASHRFALRRVRDTASGHVRFFPRFSLAIFSSTAHTAAVSCMA